jgi:hypothetical protein
MVAYPFLPRRGAAEKIFQQQDTPPLSFPHLNTTFDNTSLHHDFSTVTGEEVILFTLAEAPLHRHAKNN